MEHQLGVFLHQYGYFGLFIALAGGIIGLPFPDEFLMAFVGYQISKGSMSFGLSVLIAFIGACVGSTLSYLLGAKLGLPIITKIGPKIYLSPQKLAKGHDLLRKYGNVWILFGYFIPGLRHINGYVSGITKMGLLRYAIYAYTGALFWCLTFITIGCKLKSQWLLLEDYLRRHSPLQIIPALILIVLTIVLYSSYKNAQRKKVSDKKASDIEIDEKLKQEEKDAKLNIEYKNPNQAEKDESFNLTD